MYGDDNTGKKMGLMKEKRYEIPSNGSGNWNEIKNIIAISNSFWLDCDEITSRGNSLW